MKNASVKKKFIEELEKTPIISVVCEKVGISRNTFYRWMNEDFEFRGLVEEAMGMGIRLVNDFAESNVLGGIQNKDPGYTKFWLACRHPEFRRPHIHIHNERETKEEYDRKVKLGAERLKKFQDKWFKKPANEEKQKDVKPTKKKKK
ncbi:MAG: hypothetical protein WC847_02520 [Candidatus Paceibacterota bacterium]|jgi:hypothetical protein